MTFIWKHRWVQRPEPKNRRRRCDGSWCPQLKQEDGIKRFIWVQALSTSFINASVAGSPVGVNQQMMGWCLQRSSCRSWAFNQMTDLIINHRLPCLCCNLSIWAWTVQRWPASHSHSLKSVRRRVWTIWAPVLNYPAVTSPLWWRASAESSTTITLNSNSRLKDESIGTALRKSPASHATTAVLTLTETLESEEEATKATKTHYKSAFKLPVAHYLQRYRKWKW